MKFIKHYTVRWHDTDANRNLTPSHLLMYMEETSDHHLRDAGMSLDDLRDRKGLAFLLSRISVRIYRDLHAGDEIEVETWVCESRGLSFNRCFRVLHNGETAAEAYTVWALLDLSTQKLLPATAFPYDIEPEAPVSSEISARVRIPAKESMQKVGTRSIVYSDIDYNGHMNNTHYPNMLCDFTPHILTSRVRGYSLSFLREAAYGHTLEVWQSQDEDGMNFRMIDENGTTCLEARLFLSDAEA